MAALVQTLPVQTTTVTMIGRPSSSGGYSPHSTQPQLRNHSQQGTRYTNLPSTGYRGMPVTGPVSPYAFTSTPQLSGSNTRSQTANAGRFSSNSHSSSQPSSSAALLPPVDAGNRLSIGLSALPTPSLNPPQPPASTNTAKPSPDRYRRTQNRIASSSAVPSGSGMAAVGSLYSLPSQSSSTPSLTSQNSYRGSTYGNSSSARNSNDDIQIGRNQTPELAARYRRRSVGNIETAGLDHSSDSQDTSSPHPNSFIAPQSSPNNPPQLFRPAHRHTPSSDSVASSRSTRSSRPGSATRPDHGTSIVQSQTTSQPTGRRQETRLTSHSKTSDSSSRQPSPLSRPVDLNQERTAKPVKEISKAPMSPATSAAVEQLSALSLKDGQNKKSKLRRAFSFGSAAELRKVTAQNNHEKSLNKTPIQAKRGSKYEDELEPEQARIAEKQEAAGLGESIYSGQGHFFTGSTDNLSISSTASSASIMLRKMGKGVKKGTRSLVGLFRPKSVIGVPAADGPVNQAPVAEVSMVTVEAEKAERQLVNVNVNPHDQAGGGTGFPKLERNSVDAKLSFDSGTVSSDARSRRSIVGGEKERAEVLAAVKKGILKRTDSNQSSPKIRAYDFKVPDFNLPHIPHVNDSPRSSAPSTPVDEPPRSGHRRTDSITIENNDHDDYFSVTRLGSIESKNNSQGLLRNISFSPRIQFHDTWPSGEYDRRGDIATCNRLTPMLAQQIKEELNTFKMEMEVHESSKVYTHFF